MAEYGILELAGPADADIEKVWVLMSLKSRVLTIHTVSFSSMASSAAEKTPGPKMASCGLKAYYRQMFPMREL